MVDAVKVVDPYAEATKLASEGQTPDAQSPPKVKRGRPAGSKNRPRAGKGPSEEALQMAFMVNGVFASALGMIGGPEALPDKKELETLNAAAASYFSTKPDFNIPPGAILLGAYLQVTISRFSKPEPKDRVKTLFVAATTRVKAWFSKKRFKHFNSGKEHHDAVSLETDSGRGGARRGGFARAFRAKEAGAGEENGSGI